MTTTADGRLAEVMSPDEHAHHAYLRALRRYWAGPLYRRVRERAAHAGSEDLLANLRDEPCYAGFAWLETSLQRRKYNGPRGLLEIARRGSATLTEALDEAAGNHHERLHLTDSLTAPRYYTAADFHGVRGGIYSRPTDGLVYEYAAGGTAMMANESREMHAVLADHIAQACAPCSHPPTVLDLGCGFGKLQGYLADVLPESTTLIGCDLSGPALRLAHLRALQRGFAVTWVQSACENMTWCLSDSIDIVCSIQLLHELPRTVRRGVLAESRRVLKTGGELIMIDFYATRMNEFETLLMRGHTVRNNEPYLHDLLDSPLAEDLVDAGLVDATIEPIQASQGADHSSEQWRLPWALISAHKP